MITTTDIQALIAFAILNNKPALIRAMNVTGNPVALNITDEDLSKKVFEVYSSKGLEALKTVLNRVEINKEKVNDVQLRALAIKFKGLDANSKFNLQSIGNFFGDLLGVHNSVTQTPTVITQTFQPPVSSTTIIILAVVAIIAVVILTIVFRKS